MKKVGVIGVGRWGINHVRTYKELYPEHAELVGISDVDSGKKNIADQHNVKFFNDYKELTKNVDFVSIVVPTDMHYKVVKDCLLDGTNVLVEKPFVSDPREAEELIQLAKDKNLVLYVGYLFRFNPVTIELKKILPELGELRAISGRYIQPNQPRHDSGVVLNLSVHLIDILNFILPKKPSTVLCKKTNVFSTSLEDAATITLGYGNFHATLELSCLHPEKKRDMFILGTNGAVYADFKEQTLIKYKKPDNLEDEWSAETVKLDKKEPLKEEIINFLTSTENEEIRKLGEEEIYTTRICQRALESANLGRELEI
ncbi:MAG: Gfo/Idh/MocA family oxidoreductase [Candidatus Aenigmarchaeota archaeon]|nr:Gfo/Idh/MocA family oxidoreductase [Candidatus Aenigmarchaeota archaeon]